MRGGSVISRAALEADVAQERRSAKFSAAVETNTGLIRSRMSAGYNKWFALYDGGDAPGMVALLRSRGYNAKIDGGVMCQL